MTDQTPEPTANDAGASPLTPATPPAPQQAPQYAAPAAPVPPVAPAAPQYTPVATPPAAPQYSAIPSAAPSNRTNVLAILSLVFAFVFSIAGIVLGHMALSQIKKTGEAGRGLALAGTILSYVFTFAGIIFVVVYFLFMAALVGMGY